MLCEILHRIREDPERGRKQSTKLDWLNRYNIELEKTPRGDGNIKRSFPTVIGCIELEKTPRGDGNAED